MASNLILDDLKSDLSLRPIEMEPQTTPAVPNVELPKEALPKMAVFASAALGTIVLEEVAVVDRIRLAELAAKGRLADMD